MARTANTFLIDLSKKIVITGGGFGDKTILYGDIADKGLWETTFEFTEDFDSGTEYMEKKLDDMLKPFTTQLQALMKKLPFIGDTVKDVAGPHFKDNLAFAYTFLQHTVNKDSDRDKNVANTLNSLFNYIVPYNIPMRKKIPQINTSKPSSITIKFAYGKCNKYNAHDEVYVPIETLRAAIMPVIGAENDQGLVTVDGVNTLPFPQQLFIKVIDSILDKGKEIAEDGTEKIVCGGKNIYKKIPIIGAAASKLNDSSGGLSGLIESLTRDLPTENPYKDKDAFGFWNSDRDYNLKNLDPQWHTKTGQALKSAIETAISKQSDADKEKFQPITVSELPGEDVEPGDIRFSVPKGKSPTDVRSKIEEKTYFTSTVKDLGVDMATAALTQSGFDVEPGQIIFNGRFKDELSGLTSPGVKVPDVGETSSLATELASIASMPDSIIANAAREVYNTWIKSKCLTIYYGFPQRFFTSIEELTDFLLKNDNYQKLARVKISGVVLAGAKFNFNLANLDEHGYPMDGSVVLSNLWSVLPPTQVLKFNGTDTVGEKFRNQDNDKAL